MEKRHAVDLQNFTLQFKNGTFKPGNEKDVEMIASFYIRAMAELGYRRKSGRKPTRVQNAPKRKSVLGVEYGK